LKVTFDAKFKGLRVRTQTLVKVSGVRFPDIAKDKLSVQTSEWLPATVLNFAASHRPKIRKYVRCQILDIESTSGF